MATPCAACHTIFRIVVLGWPASLERRPPSLSRHSRGAHPTERTSLMRPSPRVRCAALACCALTTSTTALVAASATAQSDAQTPSATAAAPTTKRERLNVRVGQTAVVTGDAAAGRTVVLQRRGHRGWRTIDRTMTD